MELHVRGALLVAGTHSDVGKTAITAGLCRWLAREGVRVAPFKAQNMALNSMVTAEGAEIGRAQAMQAAAARIAPTHLMNPVLLKPASDQRSQVIVLGQPWRDADARTYQQLKGELLDVVLDSLATLRTSYDVVICEGAGSPAEINLRAGDITNMGLARAADLPVLLVGDIDRGGVFASLLGTLAVLDPADQRHIAGYVINKFRGDQSILKPGLDWLSELTGRPCAGVLPWLPGAWPDGEDSMRLEQGQPWAMHDAADQALRVAVIHFPRLSNYTDVDPLACEPGVLVRLAKQPGDIADADLVILPGTRATVHDLQWMRDRGLAEAVGRHAAQGRPVLGICGGYQMLGRRIADGVENDIAEAPGLGLLPVTTRFTRAKTLRQSRGAVHGIPVHGYEIRHGQVQADGEPLIIAADGSGEGCVAGPVSGTSWHGIFENDAFRRAFLTQVASQAGRRWAPGEVCFAQVRDDWLDALGDLVADGLDTTLVRQLISDGVPDGLPSLQVSRVGRAASGPDPRVSR
jgi:adenosylcobyric acid synthase